MVASLIFTSLPCLGERQARVYLPNVEQLSQLFPNNWDNCSTLGKLSSAARLIARQFGYDGAIHRRKRILPDDGLLDLSSQFGKIIRIEKDTRMDPRRGWRSQTVFGQTAEIVVDD